MRQRTDSTRTSEAKAELANVSQDTEMGRGKDSVSEPGDCPCDTEPGHDNKELSQYVALCM